MCLFSSTLRRTSLLVAGIACSLTAAQAQNPAPAWLGASAPGFAQVGSGSLATDAAGNTYAAGSFSGTARIGGLTFTSQGGLDGYLAKYSPTGALLWLVPFASAGNDLAQDVALDAAGNPYVTGSFVGSIDLGNGFQITGTGTGNTRTFVARYSPEGVPQWVTQNSSPATVSGQTIALDADGAVYVAGVYVSSVSFGAPVVFLNSASGLSTFLAVFSAARGELRTLTNAFDYINRPTGATAYPSPRLAAVPDGGVYLLNTFTVTPAFGTTTFATRGGTDALVARYSAQGALQWATQIGGAGDDAIQDGKVDAAGNLYAGGNFSGTAVFSSLNAPVAATLTSAGPLDAYVVKYTPQGGLPWASGTGGAAADGWGSITLDAAGNPYATGNFNGVAQYGPSTLTSAGGSDIVVAAYTPQGQIRWAQQAGGTGLDTGFHLGLDAQGLGYVFGNFSSTPCTFGAFSVSAPTTPSNFLARLGSLTLGTRAARPLALGLHPNPASAAVSLPGLAPGTPVLVFDALGRVARHATVSATAQVSVQGLPPGLYTLRATDAQGQQFSGRVVVE